MQQTFKRLLFVLTVITSFSIAKGQQLATLSGVIQDKKNNEGIPFVNVVLKSGEDQKFITGTVSGENGVFVLTEVPPGSYQLEFSFIGYETLKIPVIAGRLSTFQDLGTIFLDESSTALDLVQVEGKRDAVAENMERKVFRLDDNIAQSGGSLLQVLQNLPGITTQDGGVQLRGSNRVAVLIDGKQTALTGFGTQTSLDNIPASSIEKIEVINNPSARHDANGNAGIINIIYKKEIKEGFNGKVGLAGGLGALWIKQQNLPSIRPQYQRTPKLNPSVSLNYRKKNLNWFFQADNLFTHTLNKNEFVDRYYDSGDTIRQQTKRNRSTNIVTGKSGVDWYRDEANSFSASVLFSSEKILDRGDEPFFNAKLSERIRLWKFLEDELKTTLTASSNWLHKFKQPGRQINTSFNYTYHRENEKYFFTNYLTNSTGNDAFKLLSDEHVWDLNSDYVRPLFYGRIEGGMKFRFRRIPTNMHFIPGANSQLDASAGGWANYDELIPALYGNYIFENKWVEIESGLRIEYAHISYQVNPTHPTYKSSSYQYAQPFPNARIAWKLNTSQVLSLFMNRRVDRPNEVDIRIFPKYDDAEIIKVGNPALRPQYTNTAEIGYKVSGNKGYLYTSLYVKKIESTITRIARTQPGNTLIYNIFQNAGNSTIKGIEMLWSTAIGTSANLSFNLNAYQNTISAFSVTNLYPTPEVFSASKQKIWSGSFKLNGLVHLPHKTDLQISAVYLAPDVVPQGKTYERYYMDAGIRKSIRQGKGELFLNATDLFNTLRIRRATYGTGFHFVSTDYYETQVFRAGVNFKF